MGVYFNSYANNSLSEIVLGGMNNKHMSTNPSKTINNDNSGFKTHRFDFTSIKVGDAITKGGKAVFDFNGEITMRQGLINKLFLHPLLIILLRN